MRIQGETRMNASDDIEKKLAEHESGVVGFMKALIAAVDEAGNGYAAIAAAATKVLEDNFELMAMMEQNKGASIVRKWQVENPELIQQFQATMLKVDDCASVDRVLLDLLCDLRGQ